MDWLHRNSGQKRLRLCGVSGIGGDVLVGRHGSETRVSGIMRCGSRICPECGPRIAAETRDELQRVMEWWTSEPERVLWFGTMTLRHRHGQTYDELISAVSDCWGAATGGRGWMGDRVQYGIDHYVRVIEEKWSLEFGWHVHVHFVLFVDSRLCLGAPAVLLKSMHKRWAAKAQALGLGAPLIRAQDLHEVGSDSAASTLATYFSKQSTGPADASDMAWEMSAGGKKRGRLSLTAGQILAWAMKGDEYVSQLWGRPRAGSKMRGVQGQEFARRLWSEYEAGRKGRRVIAWSRGLREAAGCRVRTDDELLEDALIREELQDAAHVEMLVALQPREWRFFVGGVGRLQALDEQVATGCTGAELVLWFAEHGIHAALAREAGYGLGVDGGFSPPLLARFGEDAGDPVPLPELAALPF